MLSANFFLKYFSSDFKAYLRGPKISEVKSGGYNNKYVYLGREYLHYSNLNPKESAIFRLSNYQKVIILVIILLLVFAFLINWFLALQIIFTLLTLLYFIDLFFNLFLIYRSFSKEPEIVISKSGIENVPDNVWPYYTIFCPLYKEWNILSQFTEAIKSLDYPKSKLQVLIILEEDDIDTRVHVEALNLPHYFEILIVPDSLPKTKPKACNFGLIYARGEYCVIYDAEDIPDPLQLKKAVLAFRESVDNVGCIQAKLSFYNARQNILTRLFTADYSLWFDLVLTGLQSISAPIPLGGTSNHFRTVILRTLGGWDAFNVTEDADLGMRLYKNGLKTAIMDSVTYEEATSQYPNWFKQRTRWIKGYIQTYLVHIRNPQAFVKRDINSLFYFQVLIGGKILSLLINPLMWIMTISYFVFREKFGVFVESLYFTPIFYMGALTLFIGNFLYFYYFMMGIAKTRQWDLVAYTLLVPFYWLMISISAFLAFYELIVKPHYWNKTLHGLHLEKSGLNLDQLAAVEPNLVTVSQR